MSQSIFAMKTSNLLSAIGRMTILTAAIIATSYASAAESVTNGFRPSPNRESVEVNLDRSLIELAVGIAGSKEPALAALLQEIQRVNIRVIGLDESNRTASLQRIDEIRRNLEADGWSSIITVSEGDGGDNVSVLALVDEDAITGLVVTVVDSEDEIVVLDISGRIRTEQIAELVERLNIEGLDGLSEILEEV
jgi:hypothetical protein